MTDSNPIARFRRDRQEAGKEFREKLKKGGEQIKQTTTSKVIRGALSGPLKAVNETVEFVDDIYDFAAGNPYDNNELIDLQALGLEIKGDKEDWAYTVPQAITQFLLPAGAISKGLKGTKLVGMNNAWARNALAGFVTDAVVQDPYEENLFNMIDKHPRLATPISELLKAKTPEEMGVAEARFRQATGGLVAGEALTAFGLGIKGLKKTPELYERVIKRLSRRDEILMTDNVVDNLGDEILDLGLEKQPATTTPKNTTPVKFDLPDTRGQGKFYHGTAQEIPDGRVTSVDSGENIVDSNLYGNGFYTTEDLTTASKYQKKGKKQFLKPEIPIGKGIKRESDLPYGIQSDLRKLNITDVELNQLVRPGIEVPSPDRLKDLANQARQFPIDNQFSGGGRTNVESFNKIADRLDELAANPPKAPDFRPVTYEIAEKQPVKFIDADQQIGWTDDTPEAKLIKKFLEDTGEGGEVLDAWEKSQSFSYADIVEDLKDIYQREAISKGEFTNLLDDLNLELSRIGYGGVTHQGGNLAGKGKRLHQVKIYWDAENQIDINKVDLDALADPKVQTTFNPKFTGGGDPDVQKLIIDRADKIKELDANNAWPYKRTFADMVKNANDLLPAEVIESARLFNARYGRGGEEDLPATLIAMNQLMNKNAINLASLAKTIDETFASGNKAGFSELKEQFVTEAKVLDGLITLNKPLKTVPAQTLAANRAGGGVGNVAASVDDLAGRTPAEKAIDQATDIRGTAKEPTDPLADFSMQEIIDAAEKGDKASWKKLRIITKKLQAAQGNPQALQKMANESFIMRGLKGQNEIFINSILSGPETHAVNILSTSLNTLARPLEQTLGSFAQGDMTGAIRGGKELYYLMSSITDSLKGAKLSFQIEDNIVNPGAMIQDADRFTIRMEGDGHIANIVNTFGTIIRLPSRFLLAEDEFFKQLNFRAYVKASSWEDGMRKGLQGADLQDHIQRQFDGTIEIVNKNSMANVKDKSVLNLYEKAQQYAAETTFTADLPEGSLGGAIQGVARHPAGRIIFPFVRTPINIFKAQVRRTPGVNMLLQEYRQALKSTDPSVAAKAKGEMILGGSIWSVAGITALAINDPMSELAITGGGPSDYNMLNQKRSTGWQPYSFRFLLKDENGKVRMGKDGKPRYRYVSFKRLDPWSSFLMMAADAASITGGLSKQDRDDFGVAASVALGRNITNKTYLQGITELADLLGKPYKMESWLARRAAATLNPFSSLGRSLTKATDGQIMDKRVRAGDDGFVILRKFHNELAVTIPGYGANLRPMRNFITGSIIEYPVGYGPDTMSLLNPIKETDSINNNVLTTLDDIGARITQPSDELNIGRLPSGQAIGSGIELTYDEHLDLIEETAFVKINGQTMVRALHNRIQQKDFQALMKSVRGEMIEQNNMDIEVQAQEANRDLAEGILRDIVNKYKKGGKQIWLSKNPERALEYKQLQSAIRQEANNDILKSFEALNAN